MYQHCQTVLRSKQTCSVPVYIDIPGNFKFGAVLSELTCGSTPKLSIPPTKYS